MRASVCRVGGKGTAEGRSGGSGVTGSDEEAARKKGRSRLLSQEGRGAWVRKPRRVVRMTPTQPPPPTTTKRTVWGHFLILKNCRHLQRSWTGSLEFLTGDRSGSDAAGPARLFPGHHHRASLCLSESEMLDQLRRPPAPGPGPGPPSGWVCEQGRMQILMAFMYIPTPHPVNEKG